jgi:phage tail sheath protein FI
LAVHGIKIDRLTGGVRPVETAEGAPIGILAFASGLDRNEIALVRTPADATALDDGTGTLRQNVSAIWKHTTSPVVVVGITAAELADGVDSDAAAMTGVYRLLQAEAETGVRPRLFPQAMVPDVRSDLIVVANRMLGLALLDGPNTTDAAAIQLAGSLSSPRATLCDPATIDSAGKVIGGSVLMAAIAASRDFWLPLSNEPVLEVERLSRPIGFTMGDATSQAQTLNDAKVCTIIRQDGFRLWGGLSLSADPQFKFVNVTRTDDMIAEAIQSSFLWAVDKGITRTFVEDVVESVNAFLRTLRARGAIIGGSAAANPELNSPTSVQNGELFIDYEFTPVYPAHSITFRRTITTARLQEIFS